MSETKPLLLIITQVYVPDPASVGQHMADAAEALAGRGHRVRVLTSARGYEDTRIRYPRRELRAGVDIRRFLFSSGGKRSLLHRLFGQVPFLIQVVIHGLLARHLGGIVVSTSPPMASLAAIIIGRLRRVPITYWLMDLNPDQAVALGAISERHLFVRAMRWLNGAIFARAASVIVLDRFMAERVQKQYEVRGRMEILPPWPHEEAQTKPDPSHNPFRAQYNPDDRFIVMYSGNHSPASPVTTLLEAALRMHDDPRFRFFFIGGGQGKKEVDEAIEVNRPTNIISLPYQPFDSIKHSLSAADLHVVTLGTNMVGIVHPCKIYGAMAVGNPILFIGPRPSHASELIEQYRIGNRVAHGDVDGVLAAIRKAADMPDESRTDVGLRARAAIRECFGKKDSCAAFCDIVDRSVRPAAPEARRAELRANYASDGAQKLVRDRA